jgi:DNA-binding beta-propeller fold protein YncE
MFLHPTLHAAKRTSLALKIASTIPLLASFAWAQSVVATIPATNGTEGNPMTIAVNPLTHRVYIAGSSVEVVDQNTNEVIDTISVGSGQFDGIAVDPSLRRAYLADQIQGLLAIDLDTNTVVGNFYVADISGVAVNPLTHRVYVGGANAAGSGEVQVFDGSTLAYITDVAQPSSISGFYSPIVINLVTNQIYIALMEAPGSLWVIDGNTNTTAATITGLADFPVGIDVDPIRNLIFVDGLLEQLSKVDGSTNTIISTISNLVGQPDSVSIDPFHQKVYVVNQQGADVEIVDESTNTLESTTVPVGTTPDNSVIDHVHGILYVGNTDENVSNPTGPTVSVIALQ